MTNDIERVTQQMIAICKERNPTAISPLNSQGDYLTIEPEELLAFEQAVLAKRDDEWRKQIDETSNTEIESLKAKLAATADLKARVAQLEDALRDTLGGLMYIREVHGDLYGVGWDRAINGSIKALSTPPTDYRRQLVDETIEKVAIATWNLKLNQMERHAIRDEIRSMKGTL